MRIPINEMRTEQRKEKKKNKEHVMGESKEVKRFKVKGKEK